MAGGEDALRVVDAEKHFEDDAQGLRASIDCRLALGGIEVDTDVAIRRREYALVQPRGTLSRRRSTATLRASKIADRSTWVRGSGPWGVEPLELVGRQLRAVVVMQAASGAGSSTCGICPGGPVDDVEVGVLVREPEASVEPGHTGLSPPCPERPPAVELRLHRPVLNPSGRLAVPGEHRENTTAPAQDGGRPGCSAVATQSVVVDNDDVANPERKVRTDWRGVDRALECYTAGLRGDYRCDGGCLHPRRAPQGGVGDRT